MITNTTTRNVVSTLQTLDEAQYSFDPSNMRHIAAILREMYSDPVMAVIREYSANAVDAHKMANKNIPIQVTLPTAEHPNFIVRDFGLGLADDDVKRLLLGYAASGDEKRQSNDLIGGFGIGAKSAFAVADQFTFISHHAGTASTWLCYRDQDDDCRAKKLSEVPSDSTGIEVNIPVPAHQIGAFQERVAMAYRFYSVKPQLFNASSAIESAVAVKIAKPLFSGQLMISTKDQEKVPVRWEIVQNLSDYLRKTKLNTYISSGSSQITSCVVMGDIWYPIDDSQLDNQLVGLVLYAPIGSLQLAPSREALSYTGRVKETLLAIIRTATKEIEKGLLSKFDLQKDCLAQLRYIDHVVENLPLEVRRSFQKTGLVNALRAKSMSTSGFLVQATDPFLSVLRATVKGYFRNASLTVSDALRANDSQSSWTLSWKNPGAVVLSEKPIPINQNRELFARVCSVLLPDGITKNGSLVDLDRHNSGYPSWCLIQTPEEHQRCNIPWVKDGSIPVLKLESIPETPDAFWRKAFSRQTTSTANGGYKNVYAQHSKKFNRLKENVRYGSTKSKHWETVDAESLKDKDSVIYVFHDRFTPVLSDTPSQLAGDAFSSYTLFSKFNGLFPELENGLIGIRLRDKDWVGKNAEKLGLKSFRSYLNETVVPRVTEAFDLTADQFEMATLLYLLSTTHPGFLMLTLGASRFVPELRALIEPLRSKDVADVLFKLIPGLFRTNFGQQFRRDQNWDMPFSFVYEHTLRLEPETKEQPFSPAATALRNLAERVKALTTGISLLNCLSDHDSMLRSGDIPSAEALMARSDRPLMALHNEKKETLTYQLLLCAEKIGL